MENNTSQKLTYTVKEIAQILNVSDRTAYYYCSNTNEFKVKRIGRTVRVIKKSFDEWFSA